MTVSWLKMSRKSCFFAVYCNRIDCDSESDWKRLSEIKEKNVGNICFPEAETLLEVMLLKADLFFQHTFDLSHTFVCNAHYDMLVQPSYLREISTCSACVGLRKGQPRNRGGLRNISVSQAITLFEVFKLKNTYGKFICPRCRNELAENDNVSNMELHKDAFACLFDGKCTYCLGNEDFDYFPTMETSNDDEKIEEQRIALNQLLDVFGSKKRIMRTESYKDLSHRVKLRYINLARFLFTSIASFIAMDDREIFIRTVCNDMNKEYSDVKLDGKFCQILRGVSEAYSNVPTWQSRREILSIVAPKIPLKVLQLFIPGLTEFRFSAARFHAVKYGMGSRVIEKVRATQRFDEHQVAHFVDFIISPHVCIDLPFGEKTLKLSSGEELYVPNTIRNMVPTRIIDQYFLYCEEMCENFEPLARNSLLTILDVCKASTRKSLQGIDYFAADAAEGFEGIRGMIETTAYFSSERNRLLEDLKRARLYLKTDYKVHVSRASNIADHCCIYALSDPKKNDFSQECDHDHEETCHECSNITSTLDEIEHLIESSEGEKELLDRSLGKFRHYRESIESWKAHLLRSFNQDLCREELLNKLSDDEIYLNLDWAMKFLPVKSREPQCDFFGKRGISWHITVVIKRRFSTNAMETSFSDEFDEMIDESVPSDECNMTHTSEEVEKDDNTSVEERNNTFEYKVFVHVFDECAQDSEAIQAVLKDVLCRVKKSNPEITKTFVRSDNAGCYHSSDTIASVVQLSRLTGTTVKRVDFCDPQGGKGPCDRYAAVIKSNVRRYLNENHNVTNATEFVEACHSYKGVKGVLAVNCRLEKNDEKNNTKCTINQIRNFYNFEYKEDGLLVHRSWNVGLGMLIQWSRLNLDRNIGDIVSSTDEDLSHDWIYTEDRCSRHTKDADESKANGDEVSQSSDAQVKLYTCDVEEGCTAEFLNFGSLINHILLGKHSRTVERFR